MFYPFFYPRIWSHFIIFEIVLDGDFNKKGLSGTETLGWCERSGTETLLDRSGGVISVSKQMVI